MEDTPRVEFVLGSEVSSGHFFKSSFARSFVTNCRDTKSLDHEFLNNSTIIEKNECNGDTRNNNFFSLINFNDDTANIDASSDNTSLAWKNNDMSQSTVDANELEKLRKKCQRLTEENRRLQNAVLMNQVPYVQVIDNVFLQTQVDTLQWQLKQTEANREMYRSLMEQVVRFLDRARKGLDLLHEKNAFKDKGLTNRVPRSRSVHTVHADHTELSNSDVSIISSTSLSGSSRFTRAKSVAQISPGATGFREFTWSVWRRNDPVHCTPPRAKPSQGLNQTTNGVIYRRPKQVELNPDDVPPEKLSQEAFRLMRTVQSLLATKEPDLVRMMTTTMEDNISTPSPFDHHRHQQDLSPSLQSGSFMNSTSLQEATYVGCSSGDRGNDSSSTESDSRMCFLNTLKSSPSVTETDRSFHGLLAGVRRSLDTTSLNSGSSKTTEEDDPLSGSHRENESFGDREMFTGTSTSTPNRRGKKVEKKEATRFSRPKPATSVSSAEDESGFSSMSSFQEVGLPATLAISPIKGCHTEVGLPEVPLEKIRHRRWSSTPAEIQALLTQHDATFSSSSTTTESLSVWV